MQKEIENLEFVREVNFEFIDSLKNNGTKYFKKFTIQRPLLTLPRLGDIGVWAQSTLNTKHNLFHQSKLGRDVELQNTHIVLFKSPGEVMQVTTLSTQLGLAQN